MRLITRVYGIFILLDVVRQRIFYNFAGHCPADFHFAGCCPAENILKFCWILSDRVFFLFAGHCPAENFAGHCPAENIFFFYFAGRCPAENILYNLLDIVQQIIILLDIIRQNISCLDYRLYHSLDVAIRLNMCRS